MFILFLAVLLAAAAVHASRLRERTAERVGEVFLLYVLVGYCGLPMLAVAVGILAAPERMAEMLPTGPPSDLLAFFGWAYLGMALAAVLGLWYRGTYLIGPAVVWAVYFLGATAVHLHGVGAQSGMSHGGLLAVFATHGLISVLLLVALGVSGVWKRRR